MDVIEIKPKISENDIIIDISDAQHKLDEFTLNISSFKVKRHSLNYIIGPIGSGKSTLFNAILNELQT
jgi:ATP-binding cassette subfamily C (CFTR/MRP) protein 1